MSARPLRTVGPTIQVSTRRVRFSLAPLAVNDDASAIGDTVTTPTAAADVARAVIGGDITECVLAIFLVVPTSAQQELCRPSRYADFREFLVVGSREWVE